MTTRFEAFKAALEALCHEHGVQLSTTGYDFIRVTEKRADEPAIWQDCIEDGLSEPLAHSEKPR